MAGVETARRSRNLLLVGRGAKGVSVMIEASKEVEGVETSS